MSGTSIDAIDAVLMNFSKSESHVIDHVSEPITTTLKDRINRVIAKQTWPQKVEELDTAFAKTSARTVRKVLTKTSLQANQISAIGSHGQTVWHKPEGVSPCTIQIGNAQKIADITGITTIGNFRQKDIDAGGQGAPLACAYHKAVLDDKRENRAVINLGGIANVTVLPADKTLDVIGFDTGPANTLLDAWIKKHRGLNFDKGGTWAMHGKADKQLLDIMLNDEYFERSPPKSTGREKFNLTWLHRMLEQHGKHILEKDVHATLAALTVKSITNAIKTWATGIHRILLCGGGSYNRYIVSKLQEAFWEIPVECTDVYGIPAKWLEAMAFAWLAKQTLKGKPGNIPSVTGANKKVVLGEIYKPN